MVKCPICGSEIEIVAAIDYDALEETGLYIPRYPIDNHMYRNCVTFELRCKTCRKGSVITLHKPSIECDNCIDMNEMSECAKKLFAEMLKESEEVHDDKRRSETAS